VNSDAAYRMLATKGRVKRLHVDQQRLRRGEPAVTVQTSKGPVKCAEAHIQGPSALVHRADKPLSCGAKVWMETTAVVVVI
jgi:hypothetical protein